MSWWRRMVHRQRMEKELDGELRDHIERQGADDVREGLDEAEGRRPAVGASPLEEVACYWDHEYTLTGSAQPESLIGWQFSGNLFALLGATPRLGRTLVPDDARPGRDDVAVISESLWRRRFGGRTDIIGRAMALDGPLRTIVGVMPPEFTQTA